mgnify:CR=1 FL=1
MDTRQSCRGNNRFIRRAGVYDGYVFPHRAAENKRGLFNNANLLAERHQIQFGDINAIDENPAGCRGQYPVHHIDQRTLAAATSADKGDFLPCLDFQIDVVQNVDTAFRIITEGHILKLD